MLNYVHEIPTKVYFGKGSIVYLKESLEKYGKRVLLTYGGGSIKKIGLYDEVIKILRENDFILYELDDIKPNPRIESVEKGVRICKENNIDVILAIGGGSVIDCSKAIAAGIYYEGDLWTMASSKHSYLKSLPLVDILTISATGSEFDNVAVISNMNINKKMSSRYAYPCVSICDPTYTFTVNKYQTAAGSADIMSHILEGYFTINDGTDLSEGIAETILKSVMKNCLIALKEPDNYDARANLMANSSLGCTHIAEYGKDYTGWPCHALEHELSAYYDITHGVGLAIITPRWMRYVLNKEPKMVDRFAKFAKNVMGLDDEDKEVLARKGIDALEEYFNLIGLPNKLSELNIDDKYFNEMANHANINNRLMNSFIPLNTIDALNIFKDCL